MSRRLSKNPSLKFFVDRQCHPQTIAVVQTRAKPLGYEIINLGGGRNPVSLTTLIGLIESATSQHAQINGHPFHAADLKETWADIAKADRLLDWRPSVTHENGLRRTVAWHGDQRDFVTKIAV